MSILHKMYTRLLRSKKYSYQMEYPTWTPWASATERIRIHPTTIVGVHSTVAFWMNDSLAGHISLEIDENSHVFCSFNLMHPHAKISVSKRCQLGNVLFACAEEISIGDDVIMAWGINILDSNHHLALWD